MSATSHAPRVRSLYRRLLRELPTSSPSTLLRPSPLQRHIRTQVSTAPTAPPPQASLAPAEAPLDVRIERNLEAADQYVQYLRAQRVHTTLLERYNPGMNMTEEDRIRLTARRVGMDLPVDVKKVLERMGGNEEGDGGGNPGKE
ncbi:MAG: hypothetical protein Q9162_002039 [Coniocarpon cinnabarinum]